MHISGRESDAMLERLVRQAVRADERLFSCDIRTQVHAQCASLAGVVPYLPMRVACERAVAGVPGIKAIFNEIAVEVPADDRLTDETVRRAAMTKLAADVRFLGQRVVVTVRDRWLWLDGIVDAHPTRMAAQEVCEHVGGIRGLSNLVQLTPRECAGDTQQRIMDAIERRLGVEAARVFVKVEGRTARLLGCTASIRLREQAEECVWAPGIVRAQNEIEIRC